MSSILRPGYVRWDGLKYVLDPDIEIVGPPGLPGPPGAAGANGTNGPPGQPTIIFAPQAGSGVVNPPAYANWSDVVTAVNALNGSTPVPVTIMFDDSNGTCNIPSNAWDFGPLVTFAGNPAGEDGLMTNVNLLDGASFGFPPVVLKDIQLVSESNSPVVTSVAPQSHLELINSSISSVLSTPFFQIGNPYTVFLKNGSTLIFSGANVINSTAQISVYFFSGEVYDGALTTTDSILYYVNSSSDRPSINQTVGGSISVTLNLHQGNLDPFGVFSFGSTAQRPSIGGFPPGFRFFDTTLGAFIVWNGSAWIVPGGTVAPSVVTHVDNISFPGNNYNALNTDDIIVVGNHTSPFNIQLPSSPTIGHVITIKDGTGIASHQNQYINVNSGSFNINPPDYGFVSIPILNSYRILTNSQAVSFTFDGAIWQIVHQGFARELSGPDVLTFAPGGSTTTLVWANQVVMCFTNTSSPTVNLPPTTKVHGVEIIVKDFSGTAATHNITVSGNGNTIDGASSVLISTNFGFKRFYSFGNAWYIIGQ